jgi:hypothetical protein
MTSDLLCRIRTLIADTFTCASPDEAADAMAGATRWGWLPALSGVAIAAGQVHAGEAGERP